jgi:hypothetical protein
MAAKTSQTSRRIGRSTWRRVVVGAAVLLVALPLAISELHAQGEFQFGSVSSRSGTFTYGWPWPCVDLDEWELTLMASPPPPQRTYTWHFGLLCADAFICAGALAGAALTTRWLFDRGRLQFTLRGYLFATICTGFLLMIEPESSFDNEFVGPMVGVAVYCLIRVAAGCLLAAALPMLSSPAVLCFRRMGATG